MTLTDYKKPITASFARHARGGFADWRHCRMLCDEVTEELEEAARYRVMYPRRTALLEELRRF